MSDPGQLGPASPPADGEPSIFVQPAEARSQLETARDVLHAYGLPAAERLDQVLRGSDADVVRFLTSQELWGSHDSIVYWTGLVSSPEAQRRAGDAFRMLGEWQLANGLATPDVTAWVALLRGRRELLQVSSRESDVERRRKIAVPWSTRDVWLGLVTAAVLYGIALAVIYVFTTIATAPDLDIWVAVVPTLFELLFLVPVWWYAVRKGNGAWKRLGFVRFPVVVLGIGIALLFAFYFFEGFYATLLRQFGLDVQTDLTPLAEQLSSLWPLIVTTVIVAPLVEEIFFRGFVFAGLRARYDWRWAAVISAALFSAGHMELTFFIPGFLLGLLFAYLYERSNSIWPGVIMHFLVNSIAMTALYVTLR